MKRWILDLSAAFLAVSCQFYTPDNHSVYDYTKELSQSYMFAPVEQYLKDGLDNGAAWTYDNWPEELLYSYSPDGDGSWICTITQKLNPERTVHEVDGSIHGTVSISGTKGRYSVIASGVISENNGYRTDYHGEIIGDLFAWKGTFHIEISRGGIPLDWGEVEFDGSDNTPTDYRSGHYSDN